LKKERFAHHFNGFFEAWQESLNIAFRVGKGSSLQSRLPLAHYSMLPASGYPLAGCSPAEPASVSPDISF